MNIVLIETSGNQRYIFSTNKLRENVGASELTFQIGTEVVERIIRGKSGVTEIITTSGKALLLVEDERVAKDIVGEVTKEALEKMPGLTVHGAIWKVEDETNAESLHKAVGEVHHRLEDVRYQIPSNLQRFQRLPFAAECASSNLPASKTVIFKNSRGNDAYTFSKVTTTKRGILANDKNKLGDEKEFKKGRITDWLEAQFNIELPKNLEKFEEVFPESKWLAVVHSDGNGLGQIFLDFDEHADMTNGETYKKDYKDFSDAIDDCTKQAFGKSLSELQKNFSGKQIPVLPLILGGDDLTFICDGEYAINLTKDFLQNFETENSNNDVIRRVLTREKPLGICAGIAIIKSHYPFHQAYNLAEELLQSAKKTKKISTSLSALDYHVLYDSSGTTLEDIREKTPFVARPYVVTPKETAKSFVDIDNEENRKKSDSQKEEEKLWIENHHFCKLVKRVKAMSEKDDDDKNKLPNSQLHILREGLYVADTTKETQEEVDARAKLIAHRYDTFKKLYDDEERETLFFDALLFDKREGEDKTKLTHFLDALDVVKFWK